MAVSQPVIIRGLSTVGFVGSNRQPGWTHIRQPNDQGVRAHLPPLYLQASYLGGSKAHWLGQTKRNTGEERTKTASFMTFFKGILLFSHQKFKPQMKGTGWSRSPFTSFKPFLSSHSCPTPVFDRAEALSLGCLGRCPGCLGGSLGCRGSLGSPGCSGRLQPIHQVTFALPPGAVQVEHHIGAHRALPGRQLILGAVDLGHVPWSAARC